VDASHPQLAGRVKAGFDAVATRAGANTDCLGAGTQVAGLIAAQQMADVGFVGAGPSARIVPVRVLADQQQARPDPALLARGIDWAAANGVHVIDIPFAIYSDNSAVRVSIAAANQRGVTVVAPAGARAGRTPPTRRRTRQAIPACSAWARSPSSASAGTTRSTASTSTWWRRVRAWSRCNGCLR
jgi:hypothetical protein